jgi:hypothetical protein
LITIVQAYDISTLFSFLPKKHNKLLACFMFHLNRICSEKIPLSLILNFLIFHSNLFFCLCPGEQHSLYWVNDGRHLFFHSFPFLCLGVYSCEWVDVFTWTFLYIPIPSWILGSPTCCLEKCRPELHFKVGLESFSNNFLNLLRFILPQNICPFEMP